jgi:hypothetical protein
MHGTKLESVGQVVGACAGIQGLAYSSDLHVMELEMSGLFMVKVHWLSFFLGYNIAVKLIHKMQ